VPKYEYIGTIFNYSAVFFPSGAVKKFLVRYPKRPDIAANFKAFQSIRKI
jgi:hypothetical protein